MRKYSYNEIVDAIENNDTDGCVLAYTYSNGERYFVDDQESELASLYQDAVKNKSFVGTEIDFQVHVLTAGGVPLSIAKKLVVGW